LIAQRLGEARLTNLPAQDYAFLYEHGAAAVFGPGTPIPRSAAILQEKLGVAPREAMV
jgi:methylmalonyl-CoA mutase cobalamin-binding domain/chain